MISPAELVRFSGSSAVLECHFDSCAGLLWNGPRIRLGVQNYTITTGEYSTILSISNVSEDDEGQYFCTCNNGRSSTSADLIIHRKYSS